MMIPLEKLLHLPVETAAGTRLGVVASINIDVDTHLVAHYIVRPALLPRLLTQELLISPSQVVAITAEKMVVEDAILKTPAAATSPIAPAS